MACSYYKCPNPVVIEGSTRGWGWEHWGGGQACDQTPGSGQGTPLPQNLPTGHGRCRLYWRYGFRYLGCLTYFSKK